MYSTNLSIFTFDDYRRFLQESVIQIRRQSNEFSFRKFSRAAGFASPNFLKLVMEGDRNLSTQGAQKIAQAFSLKSKEQTYFQRLVAANQANTYTKKIELMGNLARSKSFLQSQPLVAQQFDYYSHWHNIPLREMLSLPKGPQTAEQLAKAFKPAISAEAAEKSLARLQSLGFIFKGQDGRWQMTHQTLMSGNDVVNTGVSSFHLEMIRLGSEALERFPKTEREISSATVAISSQKFELIREKIRMLKQEILEMSAVEENADTVVQINFQLFPFMDLNKEKK